MTYYHLESVGSAIRDDGITFPLNLDGTPNMSHPVHIDDCRDDWKAKLSVHDEALIQEVTNERK